MSKKPEQLPEEFDLRSGFPAKYKTFSSFDAELYVWYPDGNAASDDPHISVPRRQGSSVAMFHVSKAFRNKNVHVDYRYGQRDTRSGCPDGVRYDNLPSAEKREADAFLKDNLQKIDDMAQDFWSNVCN